LHKRIALAHQLATGLCNPVRKSRTAFNIGSRHLWIELLAKIFSGCNRTRALSAFTVPLLPSPQSAPMCLALMLFINPSRLERLGVDHKIIAEHGLKFAAFAVLGDSPSRS
jgi:hypothetical protein